MNTKILGFILIFFAIVAVGIFQKASTVSNSLYPLSENSKVSNAGAQGAPDPDIEAQRAQDKADNMGGFMQEIMSFNFTDPDPEAAPIDEGGGDIPPPPLPSSGPIKPPVACNNTSDADIAPCDPRTGDAGIQQGWSNGTCARIRTCTVTKIGQVNSQISGKVADLIAAAQAAGVNLSGGSFRSCSGQVAIYRGHCPDKPIGDYCPQPDAPRCNGAAKPGFSNHQMGFAIDFNCDGSLIPRYHPAAGSNKCFQWLVANAARYGLYEWGNDEKLPISNSRDAGGYEGWHWSIDGQ